MSQIRNRGYDALFDMKTFKVINYEQCLLIKEFPIESAS